MKLQKSQIELLDFSIIDTRYKFIEPSSESIEVKDVFSEYDIDIDFMPKMAEGNQIVIFIKVSINEIDIPKIGYSIFAEGIAVFDLNGGENMDRKTFDDYVWSAGISIAINCIRNYICIITQHFPFGKYILPAVDLREQVKEKNRILNKKKPALKK